MVNRGEATTPRTMGLVARTSEDLLIEGKCCARSRDGDVVQGVPLMSRKKGRGETKGLRTGPSVSVASTFLDHKALSAPPGLRLSLQTLSPYVLLATGKSRAKWESVLVAHAIR